MVNLQNLMKNWYISYDPYSDRFQIYDDVVFQLDKDKISVKKNNDIKALYSKDTSRPILFEINSLYDKVGVDIDNMVKSDIIELIKPYINQYV